MTEQKSPAALFAESSVSWMLHRAAPGAGPHRTVLFQTSSLHDVAVDDAALRAVLLDTAMPEDTVDRLVDISRELASNALHHARPELHLLVWYDDTQWVVAVTDGAPERALAPRRDLSATSGLHLVAELADRYGVQAEHEHKVVWAALDKQT